MPAPWPTSPSTSCRDRKQTARGMTAKQKDASESAPSTRIPTQEEARRRKQHNTDQTTSNHRARTAPPPLPFPFTTQTQASHAPWVSWHCPEQQMLHHASLTTAQVQPPGTHMRCALTPASCPRSNWSSCSQCLLTLAVQRLLAGGFSSAVAAWSGGPRFHAAAPRHAAAGGALAHSACRCLSQWSKCTPFAASDCTLPKACSAQSTPQQNTTVYEHVS